MAFDEYYRAPITQSEYYNLDGKTPRATILPFFGFQLRTTISHTTETYGGNTYVTKVGTDTYKVSQSPTGLYSRGHYYKELRRDPNVLTDPKLETQVQDWLKKNKFNDIWMTPYISPNLEDFHHVNGEGPKNALFNVLALLCALVGIGLTAALFLMGDLVRSLPSDTMDFSTLQLSVLPAVGGVGLAIFMLVKKYQHNKAARALPLSQTSQKYQDALRKRYYKGLVLLFGQELGTKMQEFIVRRDQFNNRKRK